MFDYCIFIYSENEDKYLKELHRMPKLSQEFEKTFNTMPRNKAEIDGVETEYTQMVILSSQDNTNVSEWIDRHRKQWKDTEVLGVGKVVEIRGRRKF